MTAIHNPLTAKLSSLADLDGDDRRVLEQLSYKVGRYAARDTLVASGVQPKEIYLIVEGWGFRYKIVANGTRQIVGCILPGDICNPDCILNPTMDHAIGLLTTAKVALIPKQALLEASLQRSAIAHALWRSTMVEGAISRDWIVSMGRRSAYERLAHLLCELWERSQKVGAVVGRSMALPMTQEQLGDATGMTPVHVNRTLRRLRMAGLIEPENRRITIVDLAELRRVSGFNPDFLHINGSGSASD